MCACGKGIIASDEPLEKRALQFRCNMWRCEFCAPVKLRELRSIARQGRPCWRLDLTIKQEPGLTPSEEARKMVKMWRMVRQWSERIRGERLEFLAVFERHPSSGRPHMHILLRCTRIDVVELRAYLDRLNGTRRCTLRNVKGKNGGVTYGMKYGVKGPEQFEGCKRWWKSQNWVVEPSTWEKPVKDANVVWELREITPHEWMHACLMAGFEPEEKRPGYWEARPRL
jgi:hypothetical protein